MLKITKAGLKEIGYDIKDEAKLAALFGIGNGYYGIRGSLEEFGDVFIQGCYVRGVFDQIVEIPNAFADNLYMKKYYFDLQKLKEFEKEDSTINICDPTTIRFYVGGKLFLPWEGKILKWERLLENKDGGLKRKVLWDDGEGHITEFTYERYCSFANNHVFFQKATARKINHDLPVIAFSGVDTLVKTNGQHKSVVTSSALAEGSVSLSFSFGDLYSMTASLLSRDDADGFRFLENDQKDGVYGSRYEMDGQEASIAKIVSLYASCDPVKPEDVPGCMGVDVARTYLEVKKEHLRAYRKAFAMLDIEIDGDPEVQNLLRYANYQTLIGFDRFDSVHSLSAKNLTAEKYNQFVWWDCEIFQLPILFTAFPDAAKRCLEYRYRCLEEAKNNAKKEGLDGAHFAFCSSVKGDEKVWIYARHPFLQIHISGDVAYAILQYHACTGDDAFLKEKGFEMIVEALKYFMSRSTEKEGMYHLLSVTGTDEHHDYVDDDAYTNYQVRFVAKRFLDLADRLGYAIDEDLKARIVDYANRLYVQKPAKNGVIPQFEGYLSLKPYLPLAGNGAAKGFQMKASGLYHESQIIKQPDVINLYTYLDIGMDSSLYGKNWAYYEKKCEASSSLTYPAHAIAAVDNRQFPKFVKYLKESMRIDIDDLHSCAYQGVHAACIAGGRMGIVRGLLGVLPREEGLVLDPKFGGPFSRVKTRLVYRGATLELTLEGKRLDVKLLRGKPITVLYRGKALQLAQSLTLRK